MPVHPHDSLHRRPKTPRGDKPSLVHSLHQLYHGRDRRAVRFRYQLLAFDVATVLIFIVDSMVPPMPSLMVLDMTIACLLIADFIARMLIAPNRWRYLVHPLALVDVVVILTLLMPFLFENFAFLRILRALRLLRSYRVIDDLQKRIPLIRGHKHFIIAVTNLAVFVFVVTAFVYVTQKDISPDIHTYVDALYFTVTTLTTTGYGDITLQGDTGRLLAVVIMLAGIGLFLRLVQAVFRPERLEVKCPDCGLASHEVDAVHCRHCGRLLHIERDEEDL